MRPIALLLFVASATVAAAQPTALPRSTPEAQGVPSAAILAFVEAAEKNVDALHSLMVLRHGHVVAEGWWGPYGATTRTCSSRSARASPPPPSASRSPRGS